VDGTWFVGHAQFAGVKTHRKPTEHIYYVDDRNYANDQRAELKTVHSLLSSTFRSRRHKTRD